MLKRIAISIAVAAGLAGSNAGAQSGSKETADTLLDATIKKSNVADCLKGVDFKELAVRGQEGTEGRSEASLERLILAVDSSGSMAADVDGQTKMSAAKAAASDFLSGMPEDIDVGLVVFGHAGNNKDDGRALSCSKIETLYPLSPAKADAITTTVNTMSPKGWTPLAAAIRHAGAMFGASQVEGEQVLYVVSDGVETCGGDPVGAARELRQSSAKAILNIIGFDLPSEERAQLEAAAAAGGGRYLDARTSGELKSVLRRESEQSVAGLQLSAQGAAAQNTLAANAAIGGAQLCVDGRLGSEELELNSRISQLSLAGDLSADAAEEARTRLEARHRAIRTTLAQYQDAMANGRDHALREIAADLQEALRAR